MGTISAVGLFAAARVGMGAAVVLLLGFLAVGSGAALELAGNWDHTETANVTCIIEGEESDEPGSGAGTVLVHQNGTTLTWDTNQPGIQRTAVLDGNIIHVSGPFVAPFPGSTVTFTSNNFVGTGTVSQNREQIPFTGSGIAAGTACVP